MTFVFALFGLLRTRWALIQGRRLRVAARCATKAYDPGLRAALDRYITTITKEMVGYICEALENQVCGAFGKLALCGKEFGKPLGKYHHCFGSSKWELPNTSESELDEKEEK